ncbi:hypothetical protein B0H14DRAFT_3147570, partial [Mycena olivaceomarginata]
DEDLANLINEILDDVNTALNKLVPKLGLDGLLTPVDAAVSGLLAVWTLPSFLVCSPLSSRSWLVSEALSADCWLGSISPAFRFFYSAHYTNLCQRQPSRTESNYTSSRIKFRYQYFCGSGELSGAKITPATPHIGQK